MKIWIINHTAIPPAYGGLVRHYYFSRQMRALGHEVKIFTGSRIHNTDINITDGRSDYVERDCDGVPYTFVRTMDYERNDIRRVINMLEFALRMFRVAGRFEKPDVIYASSPDPFAVFGAIMLANRFHVPCVTEIRDLWPESIVGYAGYSRANPLIGLMYLMEKWMYKKSDSLIFTTEGGSKYIIDKGWSGQIGASKVFYINNGIDCAEFDANAENFVLSDPDLDDPGAFKLVYSGSVRKAHNLGRILNALALCEGKAARPIKFIVYGDGFEREPLIERCKQMGLSNVLFKGRVSRKYIPGIVTRADANVLIYTQSPTLRYGSSQNKLFEYMASGRPVLSCIKIEYDIVERYGCGLTVQGESDQDIADAILKLCAMPRERLGSMGQNGREGARDFDYDTLGVALMKVIDETLKGYRS